MTFAITEFLEKVRDRKTLFEKEIQDFVHHLSEFDNAQIGAFLAHVYHQPLSPENTVHLTLAMRDSGAKLSWQGIEKPVVDKHSTGGVGDKITICLSPLIAALGLAMPTISGKGLGFTGGTVDKLESIPGFNCTLTPDQIQNMVRKFGFAFGAQTNSVAPADKTLYALRDITQTVSSLPLITSSILSKKLAESLDHLVCDVKFGSGAILPNLEDAKALAKMLTTIANKAGTKTTAFLTDMNQPLGQVSGNWCEVAEAARVLKQSRKDCEDISDTRHLTIAFATQLLLQTEICKTKEEAQEKIERTLESGKPFELFCKVISHQGGKTSLFEKETPLFLKTKHRFEIRSDKSGFVQRMNTKFLGEALVFAGAGRQRPSDVVLPNTALHHPVKLGDSIQETQILCTIFTDCDKHKEKIFSLLKNAYVIREEKPPPTPLIKEVIS